jgi:uncharacterized protein YprB with RNaseH-like and TPR domain
MDLSSRLRAIVKSGPPKPLRELTYEPDTGGYEAVMDLARVGAILGGRSADTPFGQCLVIDRRYEADRFHGSVRIGACEVEDGSALGLLDPALNEFACRSRASTPLGKGSRTVFIDLETTGLSGGAGTVAFLVGCGYFDLGAFQVRQFLLTSFASERALLAAVASFFEDVDLIVTYNGKTFDVPVMETRWMFHRLEMPLADVPHFDMLHPARRLWRMRAGSGGRIEDSGCRLSTLEQTLFNVTRVGDVDGFEIPGRFFTFLRSGDPRPLEPVLEHNRLDLVSLAAVMARGLQLAREGHDACRDAAEALALGRVYERAGSDERLNDRTGAVERADACYRHAADSPAAEVKGEALYRIGLRYRRERRFADAAAIWRSVVELTEPRAVRRIAGLRELREFAVEALAIHHEHRERDLEGARELALFALEEADGRRADGMRHRIARIDRKMSVKKQRQGRAQDAQLFTS